VLGLHLVITVWFPYMRWFLLVILNLSRTIAVRALLTRVIYPTTAITIWTNLHGPAPFMLSILLTKNGARAPRIKLSAETRQSPVFARQATARSRSCAWRLGPIG
jgi:hypothetical protein